MKHTARVTAILLLIFILSQVVGLFVINEYITVNESGEKEFADLPFGQERPEMEANTAFIFIIVAVLIGTAIAFGLIKFKLFALWKLWFFVAICLCLSFAFSPFVNQWIALGIAAVLAIIKIYKPNVLIHNLTELFIYSGIAVILVPLMNLFAGIMMLLFISLYDYWAVFHSKHMIKLAESQSQAKVFAGLLIPYGKDGKIGSLKEKTVKKEAKVKSEKKSSKPSEDHGKIAVLGGGDLAFSLIFAGIVLKDYGFMKSLIIPLFAAVALAYIFYRGEKGKFYSAMPFITAGCLVGYLVILLL